MPLSQRMRPLSLILTIMAALYHIDAGFGHLDTTAQPTIALLAHAGLSKYEANVSPVPEPGPPNASAHRSGRTEPSLDSSPGWTVPNQDASPQVHGGRNLPWHETAPAFLTYQNIPPSRVGVLADAYSDAPGLTHPRREAAQTPTLQAMKPSPNLLVNSDFENGKDRWDRYGTAILTLDTIHHTNGSRSLKISHRVADWSTVSQNITAVLKTYGPGSYQVSVKAKTAAGRASSFINIELYDSSRHDLATRRTVIDDQAFVEVGGVVNVTWTGTLHKALILLSTGTSGHEFLRDLYIDEFKMVKLNYQEPLAAPPTSGNLARGTTVTASSALGHPRHSPRHIINGREDTGSSTHWAADLAGGPQWVQIDLGRPVSFNRVEMFLPADAPPRAYEVQYRDGPRWVNCFRKVEDNTAARNSHVFDAITAAQIRVYVTAGPVATDRQDRPRPAENVARIAQVQVYNDRNLALHAAVRASSTQAFPNYSPQNIVDGVDDTRDWNHWATDLSQGPQWVEIDLRKETTFRRIEFYTHAGYEQTEYQIQYWSGTEWVNCFPRVTGNRADHNSHSFAAITSQRLRAYLTVGNAKQDGLYGTENIGRITEIKVFSSGGVYSDAVVYPKPISQERTERQPRTAVGAIRWDGWGSTGNPEDVGSITERTLSPPKYHHRLPWYASVGGADLVRIPRYTQGIMDREIEYARTAGIDYWAFVMYESSTEMAAAREFYLSSEHKEAVKWAAILGASAYSVSNYPWLVAQFKTGNYQKVLMGRPLVYVRGSDVRSKDELIVKTLRAEAQRQGTAEPYIVIMDTSVKDIKLLQGDAVTAYTSYGSKGQPYGGLAAIDVRSWMRWAEEGAQVVPIVTAGWDPRPRVETPNPWAHYNADSWAQAATPRELAYHLGEAIDWNNANACSSLPNALLIYAWNENDEGGWLIPTLGEDGQPDTSRLDAIRAVLRPTSPRMAMGTPESEACAPLSAGGPE